MSNQNRCVHKLLLGNTPFYTIIGYTLVEIRQDCRM